MADGERRAVGSQTLDRGLSALREVAGERDGLTVVEVAERLSVHRTIAYRILTTLAENRLVSRGDDGRYRGASGLLELRAAGYDTLVHVSRPLLAELADDLGATVSLLVAENEDAVALAVISPRAARYHIIFSEGSRHPLDRGAAGHALASLRPPRDDDDADLAAVRREGFSITHGEVEPGAWGLAAPLPLRGSDVRACVNVITYREDLVESSAARVVHCARRIADAAAAA